MRQIPPEGRAQAEAVTEDAWPVVGVKGQDVGGPQAEAEAECDDPARRCAGDQIEVIGDVHPEVLFDRGKDRGREDAANPAAVERENLKSLPYFEGPEGSGASRPSWNPGSLFKLRLAERRWGGNFCAGPAGSVTEGSPSPGTCGRQVEDGSPAVDDRRLIVVSTTRRDNDRPVNRSPTRSTL